MLKKSFYHRHILVSQLTPRTYPSKPPLACRGEKGSQRTGQRTLDSLSLSLSLSCALFSSTPFHTLQTQWKRESPKRKPTAEGAKTLHFRVLCSNLNSISRSFSSHP